MTYYAEDPIKGQKAIKGKITSCTMQLTTPSRLPRAMDYPKEYWVFQSNNMTEWLLRASRILRDEDLNDAIRKHSQNKTLETSSVMIVNDGEGVKEGRDRGKVKFTYQLGQVKLDIWFTVEQHSSLYQKRVRKGEYVPPPPEKRHPGGRPKKFQNPFLDTTTGEWTVLMFRDEGGIEKRTYGTDEKKARQDYANLLTMNMIDEEFKA